MNTLVICIVIYLVGLALSEILIGFIQGSSLDMDDVLMMLFWPMLLPLVIILIGFFQLAQFGQSLNKQWKKER